MSRLIFKFETLNPNFRTTFFKHKNYTSYLAYSEYAIRNENTNHGLFGKVERFKDIKNMDSVDEIEKYITILADKKVPIYRGVISLREYDAIRLGYINQEKWQELLENKLPNISEVLNVKYEDLQYVGAVHLEEGHPHFQFMLWSKAKDKSNYFVKYQLKDKLRIEFTNAVFREDLLEIYKEKDLAKKNITAENKILNEIEKINQDEKFIKKVMKYEKQFYQNKITKNVFKDKNLNKIVVLLIDLKQDLRTTNGSIKYKYLMKYPDIIKKVDYISNEIINSSYDCKNQIENYIKSKQDIVELRYSDETKLNDAKQKVKEEAEKEILKLIGNKILNFERVLLNGEDYSQYRYINETRDMANYIYNFLCSLSFREENKYNLYKIKYKKQLSKQAKKEIVIEKKNSSSWNWEDEI